MQPDEARETRFRDMFLTHQHAVVAYAARRTDPPGDLTAAQDVASAVFVTAWKRLDDIGSDPLPWLLVTARHVLSDSRRERRRRRSRERRHSDDRSLTPGAVPDLAQQVSDVLVVRATLAALGEQDRELATLLAWDDLTLVQAAQVLGITPDAARTRWKRLRARLAVSLADSEEADSGSAGTHPAPQLSHQPLEARR
ncbi:MAG: sigma-70 family RNA polymerase sigma factor [Actinomycetota bacterium]|nr:MAG: sigma-70 family RNA polymerase sigma factor [Actinomycetota bacterium]